MNEVHISPKRVVVVLAFCAALIGVLHILSYYPMVKGTRDFPILMLNLDEEQNLPSLFSVALLWFSAVLTSWIGCTEGSRMVRLKWKLLSYIFFFLGLDEAISIHERIGGLFHRLVEGLNLHTFAWVFPYAVLVIVFLAAYFRFWWKMNKDTRFWVALGGGVYLTGALVCEALGGIWRTMHEVGIVYYTEIFFEEMLEISGCIILIFAFLNHLDKHVKQFTIRVSSESHPENRVF